MIPNVKDRQEKKKLLEFVGAVEANFGGYYLEHVVKVVFCTLSTSAHPLLATHFKPKVLIVDESAHKSIASIITPCGVFRESIKQIVLSGDHKQGQGISISKTSNLGHAALSRNLLREMAEDPRR